MSCKCYTLIIEQGDGLNKASEYFCNIHGYSNSCYMCNPKCYTTETCTNHRYTLKNLTKAKNHLYGTL